MLKVVIIGATSFIGKHLLKLLTREDLEISAFSRNSNIDDFGIKNIKYFRGDLLQRESLNKCIEEGCVVVNLVYLWNKSENENLTAMQNLAEVCSEKKVKKLIHCSTAMVYGNTKNDTIDENTLCVPVTEYEKTKFKIESLFCRYKENFEALILQPTAVFGPHGKNLLKFAGDLKKDKRLKNYLKSCISANRKMNLVYIDNVVAAILFLIRNKQNNSGKRFIISDDEYSENNYKVIENYLINKLEIRHYKFPRIYLPLFFLTTFSKIIGKESVNPRRIYCGKNLASLGFVKPTQFNDGLVSFADWYVNNGIS